MIDNFSIIVKALKLNKEVSNHTHALVRLHFFLVCLHEKESYIAEKGKWQIC